MAPRPLSCRQYPNIRSFVAQVNASFPIEADSFTSVHCLSLPSLVPGIEIRRLLQNIHRCLAPGGVLYLTFLDPMPTNSSLGPVMREWFEENLTVNLESDFRCRTPSQLLPGWLKDSKLKGEGSRITKVQFRAINSERGVMIGGHTSEDEDRTEEELRSTVGRMLWQEVWGTYVRADKWWWEIPECIKECIERGTYFEYSAVQAVKSS